MKSSFISRFPYWLPLLILLLALGAAVRSVNLNAPPLDFHSTRQLRNSLVARAIYYEHLPGADPQKRVLAESFQRAVGQYEPPITESIVGYTFYLTGGESFAVPRIYGTIFWLLAGIALFDLARRISSPTAALVSLTFFLILPFAVQASRSFQPDPLMTSSFIVGLYFLFRWMEGYTTGSSNSANTIREQGVKESWRWAILAGIFLGFAVLVKVVIAFIVGSVAVAAVLIALRSRFWKSVQVWSIAGLMVIPAFLYYVLGHPGRSTEYFFSWTVELIRLILSPHFYAQWLGFVGSLFGLTVLILSLAGTLLAPRGARWLLVSLWIGYLLYGLALPFQMFTHSYYHIQLIPVVALGLAPISETVIAQTAGSSRAVKAALIVIALILIGYQAWVGRSKLAAEDFSSAPSAWETIGNAIPERAEVIGLTQDYGYDLMYWGWRRVSLWPLNTDLSTVKSGDRDLAARFSDLTTGKDYFLVTAFAQLERQPNLKKILDGFPVAAQGDGFVLYDLRR